MLHNENTVLDARDIRKDYPSGQGQLRVLNGVNLQVRRGELVAIMGASGAGKSTLLHILGMLEEPTSGQLVVYDTDVASLDEVSLARFRNRHIGFVFQHHHLLPEFTALENAMMPALIARQGDAMRGAAIDLLRAVGLEKRMDHRPGELSGGECQRVAMVRALIMQPKVVLADEPSGNLDEAASAALHGLLRDIAQSNQQAFLVMTHDERLASSMDRRGYLESGVLHLED
ncbi:MAG: ABC transporter ATP-binding protein [Candidatus Latescibacterota bacterium]|nr:ABC transporter ATP-binding protein [Candidatus Latescibacterota bacterium]MEE2726200.1 ABC transporter ATP-binding protein [Candidatus Latescibacterota bacterium]